MADEPAPDPEPGQDGDEPPHPLRAQDVPALICKDIA